MSSQLDWKFHGARGHAPCLSLSSQDKHVLNEWMNTWIHEWLPSSNLIWEFSSFPGLSLLGNWPTAHLDFYSTKWVGSRFWLPWKLSHWSSLHSLSPYHVPSTMARAADIKPRTQTNVSTHQPNQSLQQPFLFKGKHTDAFIFKTQYEKREKL